MLDFQRVQVQGFPHGNAALIGSGDAGLNDRAFLLSQSVFPL